MTWLFEVAMAWLFGAVFGLMLIILGIVEWKWRIKWVEWTKEQAAIRAELDGILVEMKETIRQLQVKIVMDSVDLTKMPTEVGLPVQYGQMSIPVSDVHPYLSSFQSWVDMRRARKIQPEDTNVVSLRDDD